MQLVLQQRCCNEAEENETETPAASGTRSVYFLHNHKYKAELIFDV